MIFTSYTYILFLVLAFVIHWSLPPKLRRPFLIASSYCFYCTWRWEFGFLLLGVSIFNWVYGRWVLYPGVRARWLWLGVAANLLPLIYYKYFGFIIANTTKLAGLAGVSWHPQFAAIILPLGISFFTFQGIAYIVDVVTGEPPLQKLDEFMLFKAFWPQLIAGPIVRLGEMRDQIRSPRPINYEDVAEGCQRILAGLFKKVVLADNLAPIVEMVFLSRAAPHWIDTVTGMLGFGLQIYFDFSAYSEIAIGSARLFGYRLVENFNWPYLAWSPQEFWNRWHMSLSRWIRDYVFLPLSFAGRGHPALRPLWLLLAMAICGLWHGAAWTFVIWGLWHGLLLAFNQSSLSQRWNGPTPGTPPRSPFFRLVFVAATFSMVQLGWLLFRSDSLEKAGRMFWSLITLSGGLHPAILRENNVLIVAVIFACLLAAQLAQVTMARWRERLGAEGLAFSFARAVCNTLVLLAVIVFDREAQPFVYFQF